MKKFTVKWMDQMGFSIQATVEIGLNQNFTKKRKKPRKNRSEQKMFWTNGYQTWDLEEFKGQLRINKETFTKTPTNVVPNPIEDHRQLALYHLVHGCSFRVLADMFGVSILLTTKTFNNVIWEIIRPHIHV